MEYAAVITNLTKQYESFKLDSVSFSIPKGTIMGLVGQNGAGKTTLIKSILNLISTDGGECEILDKDSRRDEAKIKEEVGVVFDAHDFYDQFTALQVSSIMKQIYRSWDHEQFLHYMDTFQLPVKKKIKTYSKGMKAKFSIITALCHHPRLLILDEATSGLDPIVRNEILDIFMDFIQDEEHSILLSSHITSDLDKICDYITFIHDGRLIFSKEKDELIYNMGILRCREEDLSKLDPELILRYQKNSFGSEALISDKTAGRRALPDAVIDPAEIEDIMLFYVKGQPFIKAGGQGGKS